MHITRTNDKYYVVHKQVNQSQTSHLGRCTLQAHGTEVLVSQRVKDQISMVCRVFQPQMMRVSEICDPDCQCCAVPNSTCLVGLKVVLLCSHGTLAASQNSGNCDRPITSAYEFWSASSWRRLPSRVFGNSWCSSTSRQTDRPFHKSGQDPFPSSFGRNGCKFWQRGFAVEGNQNAEKKSVSTYAGAEKGWGTQ